MSFNIVQVYGKPISTQYTKIVINSASNVSSLPTDIADVSTQIIKNKGTIYGTKN